MGGPDLAGPTIRRPPLYEMVRTAGPSHFSYVHAWREQSQKHTTLGAEGLYTQLAAKCDGSHDHAPCGITKVGNSLQPDTAAGAEYPSLRCKRMADMLGEATNLQRPPVREIASATSRHVLGNHAKQAKPLVPEFSSFLDLTHEPTQSNHKLLTSHLRGENTESHESCRRENQENLQGRSATRA